MGFSPPSSSSSSLIFFLLGIKSIFNLFPPLLLGTATRQRISAAYDFYFIQVVQDLLAPPIGAWALSHSIASETLPSDNSTPSPASAASADSVFKILMFFLFVSLAAAGFSEPAAHYRTMI